MLNSTIPVELKKNGVDTEYFDVYEKNIAGCKACLGCQKYKTKASCGYPVEKGADMFEDMMKRYCKHCGLTYAGMLAERQRNLKEVFMDEEKEMRARVFAKSLL